MQFPCLAAVLIPALLLLNSFGSKLRSNEPATFKGYKQVLHNHADVQYFADFKIGGQEVSGIFDTGSFDLLVRSSRCQQCVHPTSPFDAKKSNTYRKEGTMKRYSFGSGACVTMMGYDTVEVGGVLKAKDQAIYEIVQHQINVLKAAKFAAIVGIGPGHSFNSTTKTLLMNYNIDEFSVCLQKTPGSDGFLHWGPQAKHLHPTQMYHARVFGRHHWATRIKHISFLGQDAENDKSRKADQKSLTKDAQTQKHGKGAESEDKDDKSAALSLCSDAHGCSAILDSGTSLIAAPPAALFKLSQELGEIKEDCSNLHQLPHLSFELDGQLLKLPPQAYIMRVKGAEVKADNIWDLLFFKPKIRKVDMCVPAFMQIDVKSQLGPVWILGMPFFRYFHITFDRASRSMRISKAGKNCEPEPIQASAEEDKQKSLLSFGADQDAAYQPLDVEMESLIGPSLTSQNGQLIEI